MTEKNVGYYVRLPYRVDIYPEPDGDGYTAVVPELPGCMTCADTIEELWEMIGEAKREWLEVCLEDDDYVPEPAPVEMEEYSGKFVIRMPTSISKRLLREAQFYYSLAQVYRQKGAELERQYQQQLRAELGSAIPEGDAC